MDSSHGQKWLLILFFSAIGLLFIYFFSTIVLDKTDRTYTKRLERARQGPGSYRQGEKINLIKDRPATVGKIRMTYRGLASGALLMDLVLLELDPDYSYSRRIPLKEGRRGFLLSNHLFSVTSINSRRLRLVMGPSKR